MRLQQPFVVALLLTAMLGACKRAADLPLPPRTPPRPITGLAASPSAPPTNTPTAITAR